MKRTIAWREWLFVAAASIALTTAHAATVYDTFPTKWRPYNFGSGATSEMVRNRLEVSLASDASGGVDEFASSLVATCAVGGDFDLRVPFRLLDWPDQNGSRVSLHLWDDDPFLGSIFMERASFPEGDDPGDPGEVYRFIGFGNDNTQDTSDQSGVLRLRRVGSVVTGSYWLNGNWVELGNTAIGSQDLRFSLVVWSNDAVFADSDVRAAFISVRVATGTLTGATCPTTAQAETFYDTFATKWRPISVGSGTSSEMVSNRLEVSLAADASSESGDLFASGLLATCAISGDFDLRVAYRLLDWPRDNGARVALHLSTRADLMVEDGIFLERRSYYRPQAPRPWETYGMFPGFEGGWSGGFTAHQSGVLRLRRIGPVVTGYYYRPDHGWVGVGNTDVVGTEDVRFSIVVYNHDAEIADSDVRAAFDSVRLVTGTLTGPACPFSTS